MNVDINCDMGEAYSIYTCGDDAAIMPYVSQANIACGYHASDPSVMQGTVRLAKQHGVAVGAHPSYPDRQGFGRRAMTLSAEELRLSVIYQVSAVAGMARALDHPITHVKPHGAMNNQACADRAAEMSRELA
mgnify:CR=1 FL=1